MSTVDINHDFDFEIGTWKTHVRRLLHPLTGSTTWVEMEGVTTVKKVWGGRANLVELEADGPGGHFEWLSLRPYNPNTRKWSLNFASSSDGTMTPPTIGEFKYHVKLMQIRAGIFHRRRQDLGSQLDRHGHPNYRSHPEISFHHFQ